MTVLNALKSNVAASFALPLVAAGDAIGATLTNRDAD
jgi:hypothetical protein